MKRERKIPVKADCPMEVTLNVISGKWKPAIISTLFKKTLRPKDLQLHCPDVIKRVLSHQLREMESDGIMDKKIYDEIPLRVEYFSTPLGESLKPVLPPFTAGAPKF